MVVNRCALCLKRGTLRLSHLIPKAVSRLVRQEHGLPRNPVRVDGVTAVPTSEQVTGHLLCGSCEQRLSKCGEAQTLRICCRGQNSFELREAIEGFDPVARLSSSGWAVRVPVDGTVPVDALVHFAAGVVWKRSAGSWKLHGARSRERVLGPFEEQFRLFLMGDAPFPEHAALLLEVPSDQRCIGVLRYPDVARTVDSSRTHVHQLAIPGLHFSLFVGAHMDSQIQESSLTGARLILLRPLSEMISFKSLLGTVSGVQQKGRWD